MHTVPFNFTVLMLLILWFQVLYHVLGVVPAYQTSIGPALNELCLGLRPDEVAPVWLALFLLNFENLSLSMLI